MTQLIEWQSNETNRFDIDELCQSFSDFLNDSNELLPLSPYLAAYRQLNKFFEQLGTVFSFISNDVHNKITILERMISTGDQSQHYQGLLTMIRYEQGAGILNKSSRNNPSGTRTFIRLHRALQFVHRFVEQLSIATDECCTEPLARSAYQDTLAAHHPWLVQKGAGLALKLLPKRGQLLHNVLGESNWRQMSKSQIDEHFARMSTLAREVFQQCELVITREKVGDLP